MPIAHLPAAGSLRAIDLFAGCGGLSLGLHRAGHKLLFAVEKDPMAFETFRTNFLVAAAPYPAGHEWPAWLEKRPHDIEALLRSPEVRSELHALRGKVDLVCGGPPCQGFSVGGLRNGLDARNSLPARYLDFVAAVEPTFVLMENVEGMNRKFVAKPGEINSSFVEWAEGQLRSLGYDAYHRVLNAADFGVPQMRRRVFVFGVRADLAQRAGMKAADFFDILETGRLSFLSAQGLPASRPVTVREAIDDLDGDGRVVCPDSVKFMSGTYKAPVGTYAVMLRRGIGEHVVPDSHRFSRHTDAILEFYGSVHSSGLVGRLPKSFLLAHGTKKDKKVLVDPNCPASTITTHPDEFIHYGAPRNVTVREMARIQSFPDDFVFRGRYTINGPCRRFDVARCSQVGNAVPPLLAEAIGVALSTFSKLVIARGAVKRPPLSDRNTRNLSRQPLVPQLQHEGS